MTPSRSRRHHGRGFSLVELLVALALGLLLSTAMVTVYVSSKTAFARQQQLSSLQQSVNIAFEYLTNDARMMGHMGCFTRKDAAGPDFTNLLAAGISGNYGYGLEGYEYAPGAFTLASNSPADVTTAANWSGNAAVNPNAVNTIPVTTFGGAGGLTPGSDVLVIRAAAGRPVRLAATANTGANAATFTIENAAGGTCGDGSIAKVSGLCANSHALIASCGRARVFELQSISNSTPATVTLRTGTTLGNDPQYLPEATEVFPMQTIVYYVKSASSGTGTSLYRRIFDGDARNAGGTAAQGQEQELIEGVENMQVRYGVDTTTPDPDGVVDRYVNAKGPLGDATDSVMDWNKVVAVRVGLLVRSAAPVESGLSVAGSGVVNGVTITYPTTGSKYDRRVFTTTIAVRNKISYF